jgi:hypothetical protein
MLICVADILARKLSFLDAAFICLSCGIWGANLFSEEGGEVAPMCGGKDHLHEIEYQLAEPA